MKTAKYILVFIVAMIASCTKKVETISPVAIEALKTIQPKAFDVRVEYDSDSVCMISYCDPAIHEFYFAIDENGRPYASTSDVEKRGENIERIKDSRTIMTSILGETTHKTEDDYVKWAIRQLASNYKAH